MTPPAISATFLLVLAQWLHYPVQQRNLTGGVATSVDRQAEGDGERDQAIQARTELAAAEDAHDEPALRRLLDSAFVATAGGAIVEKEAYIRVVLQAHTTQTIVHDLVRVVGDTAIFFDRVTVRTSGDATATYRCPVTLVKRRDGWKTLAGQCGVLAPDK